MRLLPACATLRILRFSQHASDAALRFPQAIIIGSVSDLESVSAPGGPLASLLPADFGWAIAALAAGELMPANPPCFYVMELNILFMCLVAWVQRVSFATRLKSCNHFLPSSRSTRLLLAGDIYFLILARMLAY